MKSFNANKLLLAWKTLQHWVDNKEVRAIAAQTGDSGGASESFYAGTDDAESKVAAERAIEGIAAGEHRDERFLVPALEDDGVLFEWEDFVGTDAAGQDDDDEEEEEGVEPNHDEDDEDDPVVNAEMAASSTDPRVTAELARQLHVEAEGVHDRRRRRRRHRQAERALA